jgi:uncharacterized protein (DUF58 family)
VVVEGLQASQGPPSPVGFRRRALRRLRDGCPLTASGGAVLALAAAAGWYLGVGRLDLILLTAALLGAGLLGLLVLATTLGMLLLRRQRRRRSHPATITGEGGTWIPTGQSLRLPAWLPFLSLEVDWIHPVRIEARAEGRSGEEQVRGHRRCAAERIERRLTVGDALGLTALTWTEASPASLQLLPPRLGREGALPLVGLAPGEDAWDTRGEPLGDRVDLRRYGVGDPLRMILWKVYARTRDLVVRIPERAVEATPRVCGYLPADPADEPAARLARTVLEDGLLGEGWRFGTEGAEDAEDLPAAFRALAASGSLPEDPPRGLAAFLRRAQADGFGTCLLFLPAEGGAWLPPVREALANPPLRIHAMLALAGWGTPPPPGWHRWFLRTGARGGTRAAGLLALIRDLACPGLRLTLVDTASGQVLEDPEAYLAKRARSEGAIPWSA